MQLSVPWRHLCVYHKWNHQLLITQGSQNGCDKSSKCVNIMCNVSSLEAVQILKLCSETDLLRRHTEKKFILYIGRFRNILLVKTGSNWTYISYHTLLQNHQTVKRKYHIDYDFGRFINSRSINTHYLSTAYYMHLLKSTFKKTLMQSIQNVASHI